MSVNFKDFRTLNLHLFHLVSRSPWPCFMGIGLFLLLSGLVFFMHRINGGGLLLIIGMICVISFSVGWFIDICEEASFLGFHTKVVRKGLVLGFLLFLVSEIMLFFGFFWAFFHAALCPSVDIGSVFPPEGLKVISFFDVPMLNTFLLVVSGCSITWAHRSVALGSFIETLKSISFTIILGFFFIVFQFLEYYDSNFNIDDGIYPSVFFMLTGLHGLHVLVGLSFIFICLIRFLFNHFSTSHYLGFIFAIWYWHFVDIVWIFLFLVVYGWGGL